jgi:hypothetical protein
LTILPDGKYNSSLIVEQLIVAFKWIHFLCSRKRLTGEIFAASCVDISDIIATNKIVVDSTDLGIGSQSSIRRRKIFINPIKKTLCFYVLLLPIMATDIK